MIPLFNWSAQRPKCFKNCVTENPKLFQDNPNLAKGFDSPICLICTIVKIFNDYYYFKIVSHQFNVSEDSYLSAHLALDDKPSFFAILWLVLLASIIWPKGLSRLYWHPSFWPRFSHFQKFQLYNWFPTFWRQKEEIYYSPVTIHLLLFMTLFTLNFCLLKGGCTIII